MLIYNVTCNVEFGIEENWLQWMKKEHIPKVLGTGKFFDHKILKLLGEHEDATGTTYAIQYFSKNIGLIDQYLNEDAPTLRKDHTDMFGTRFVTFRTLLEEV